MNMNHALQNLYKAVSGSATGKVNISKLLCDIHYAITGVESPVKNNWSRIIDSMATNWPEGSGSGNLTIAKLVANGSNVRFNGPLIAAVPEAGINGAISSSYGLSSPFSVILYDGKAYLDIATEVGLEGNIAYDSDSGLYVVTGDCTITFGGDA